MAKKGAIFFAGTLFVKEVACGVERLIVRVATREMLSICLSVLLNLLCAGMSVPEYIISITYASQLNWQCPQALSVDRTHNPHDSLWSVADLQNMYRLLCPIQSGLGVLIQEVEDHIRDIGLSAVKSLKGENVSRSLRCREFPMTYIRCILKSH